MTLEEEVATLRVEKRRLERTLQECETAIQAELKRGYVLTEEPGAGPMWRARWNGLLGKVEAVLSKSA